MGNEKFIKKLATVGIVVTRDVICLVNEGFVSLNCRLLQNSPYCLYRTTVRVRTYVDFVRYFKKTRAHLLK